MSIYSTAVDDIDFINDLLSNSAGRFYLYETPKTKKWHIKDLEDTNINNEKETLDLIFYDIGLHNSIYTEEQKNRYIELAKRFGYDVKDLHYSNIISDFELENEVSL